MRRLCSTTQRQRERRLEALSKAMDLAEASGDDARFIELREEYARCRETLAELRQGPEREDDA